MPKLLYGDCLDKMKGIRAGSIHLILADPPYGTTECQWDDVIPMEPMWEQLLRVLTPNGTIVLTAIQPFTSYLIIASAVFNNKLFKYCLVWEKNRPSGFVQAKNRPLKCHEDILVFSQGSTGHEVQATNRMVYNPQGVKRIHRKKRNADSKLDPNSKANLSVMGYRENRKKEYVQNITNYPTSILRFNKQEKHIHATQKPVALMEYLVRTYSNPGDVVMDFAMGSGTTGVACRHLGRSFIGIEKDPKIFKLARKRIINAQKKQDLGFL